MKLRIRLLAATAAASFACAAGVQATPYPQVPTAVASATLAAYQQVDPPARVARLAYLSGDVSFTPAGEDAWVEAQLNRPVVTGDRLWTNGGGRVELQIGSSTVRLDRNSSFDFLDLDDRLAQMELTEGSLNLEVRRIHGEETFEVDTPTIAFVASRVGDYRIDVDPQGYTTVIARRGGGDIYGEGGRRVILEEGQAITFRDSALQDYRVDRLGAPDGFDVFVRERHSRYADAEPRYVSRDVVGYEDLDRYGTWDEAEGYGHVWYPTEVAADWAPYHDGHWAWIDPWGWTWVDNAPWGFAPFHYGRWAYVGSRWGWVPGPVDVRPVYAPALVAFIGGSGFSVSLSTGPIGWFALGPRDIYFPTYHCDRDYFARVNVTNTYVTRTVVNNYYGSWSSGNLDYSGMRYFNRDVPHAVAAVSGSAFVSGRSVRSAAVAVNTANFANARILPRATLAPTRESLLAGRNHASGPPRGTFDRRVVAARKPPAERPSFAARQSLLSRNQGKPLSPSQLRSVATRHGGGRDGANAVRVVGRSGPVVKAPTGGAREHGVAGTAPVRVDRAERGQRGQRGEAPRSAGYAHHGQPPSARDTARMHGSANERAQARAQREERSSRAEQARAQRADRASRSEQARAQRADRSSRAEQARAQRAERASRTEQARAQRAERSRAEQARAQRAERSSRAEQARAQRAERSSRAEQARAQRIERASRAEQARAQRAERSRAEQARAERASRAEQARAQRAERSRAEQARAQRVERSHSEQAQARAQRADRARAQQQARAQRAERMRPERSAPPQRRQVERAPPQQHAAPAQAPQQRQAPQRERQMARSNPRADHGKRDDGKRDKDDKHGGGGH